MTSTGRVCLCFPQNCAVDFESATVKIMEGDTDGTEDD